MVPEHNLVGVDSSEMHIGCIKAEAVNIRD